MFHRHKWIEVERFYAPPTTHGFEGPASISQKLAMGMTTIRYECECTASKTEEILGKSMKEPNP